MYLVALPKRKTTPQRFVFCSTPLTPVGLHYHSAAVLRTRQRQTAKLGHRVTIPFPQELQPNHELRKEAEATGRSTAEVQTQPEVERHHSSMQPKKAL